MSEVTHERTPGEIGRIASGLGEVDRSPEASASDDANFGELPKLEEDKEDTEGHKERVLPEDLRESYKMIERRREIDTRVKEDEEFFNAQAQAAARTITDEF